MVDRTICQYRPEPATDHYELIHERNGVVYTKTWVVDLLLDLVGYVPEEPLANRLLVEPSAGEGAFLLKAARRLVQSCQLHGVPLIDAQSSIMAFELDETSSTQAKVALRALLLSLGAKTDEASLLADRWTITADYLLESRKIGSRADYVVGNPPYIRLEDLADGGLRYRSVYSTMKGRADVYVAFFEAALRQLAHGGVCGFICADRWMFNQYGAELRKMVSEGFRVETVAQMHNTDAFEDKVSAYPAVTVIRRASQGPVVVAALEPDAERIGVKALARELSGVVDGTPATNAVHLESWFRGAEPWSLVEPQKLALLKRLEAEFPTLEATSASVGIGVATGADKVFVTSDLDVAEADRMLPLALAQDARGGEVVWSGNYLVNPWKGKSLVDLSKYPKLRAYFEIHRDKLAGRHVGKRNPSDWFRTIDRVNQPLLNAQKLYLPDLCGRISPVLDEGRTYPHHNLYFITPGLWHIKVLGGLLLSSVAQFFVEAYGVRMRGGYLRFQAQFLRRICLPYVGDLTDAQNHILAHAFEARDIAAANAVAFDVFRLSKTERRLFEG